MNCEGKPFNFFRHENDSISVSHVSLFTNLDRILCVVQIDGWPGTGWWYHRPFCSHRWNYTEPCWSDPRVFIWLSVSPLALFFLFFGVLSCFPVFSPVFGTSCKKSCFWSISWSTSKIVKLSQSEAFQKLKIENFLQPWWSNAVKVVKLCQSGAFHKVKFQNFLQPWWSMQDTK